MAVSTFSVSVTLWRISKIGVFSQYFSQKLACFHNGSSIIILGGVEIALPCCNEKHANF
jgi:hypothetical protein